MEEYIENIQSSNINEKWLDNIYENIKKIEEYERLVREGCASLLDYVQIPLKSRPVVVGLTQFKTLRFLLTEFTLLLADLTPVLEDKSKIYQKTIDTIDEVILNEKYFIQKRYDVNKNLTSVELTKLFYETVKTIHILKRDLFKEIKHILYIPSQND